MKGAEDGGAWAWKICRAGRGEKKVKEGCSALILSSLGTGYGGHGSRFRIY